MSTLRAEIGARHGEGHVRLGLVLAVVLDNHVDVDAGIGERAEDAGDRAGLVRHAGHDDLRLVLVDSDTGDELTFHVASFYLFFADNHRAGFVVIAGFVEGAEHLHPHLFLHR
jgi:hypothetical protein